MVNTRSNLVITDHPVTALPGRLPKKSSASLPTVTEESSPFDTTVAATKLSATSLGKDSATATNDDDKIPATGNGNGKDHDDDDDDVADDTTLKSDPNPTKSDDNVCDDDDDDTTKDGGDEDGDDVATFDCSFIFESNNTCPELADELNGSYDLTFRSDKLYTNNGILTPSPTRVLCLILSTILEGQASATGREALVPCSFDLFIPSRANVVDIINSVLTFRSDNGKVKCLLRSAQSLQQCFSQAMNSQYNTFYVYVPTKKLHLVGTSGYSLPVDEWDPLNLGHFLSSKEWTK